MTDDTPDPVNNLDALADEVGRGCLSSRELPSKRGWDDINPLVRVLVLIGSVLLTPFALQCAGNGLEQSGMHGRGVEQIIGLELFVGAVVFGYLSFSANAKRRLWWPFFFTQFLIHTLILTGYVILFSTLSMSP